MPMSTFEEVVERIPNAHRYSHYAVCNCLFHDDQTPSMFIYEGGWYQCKSCRASGNLKRLSRFLDNGRFYHYEPVKVQHLRWLNYLDEAFDPEEFALRAHQHLKSNPDLGYYLKQRGVASLIQPMRLGFTEGWYTFPIFDKRHAISGLIARAGPVIQENTQQRYNTPKSQPSMLYVPDWRRLQTAPYLILTYGIFDALVTYLCGYASLTWTSGKLVDPELLTDFRKPIYIIPDEDEYPEAVRLATNLGWRGKVIRLNYPEGCKDPSDLYTREGAEGLVARLERALETDDKYHFMLRD